MECLYCHRDVKSISHHLSHCKHAPQVENKQQQYYLDHINSVLPICYCGNFAKFNNIESGFSKYCSIKCCNSDPVRIEKIKMTNLEKYGSTSPAANPAIQSKIRNTNNHRYGGPAPMCSDVIKKKFKVTCLDNMGVDNPSKSVDVQTKKLISAHDHYGCDYVFQSEIVKSKIRYSNSQRYGSDNPMNNKEISTKSGYMQKLKFFKSLLKNDRLGYDVDIETGIEDYNGHSIDNKYSFRCKVCDTVFEDHIDCGRKPICPTCHHKPQTISSYEHEIVKFCRSLLPNSHIETSNRDIIPPRELDIYISDIQLAIEFDGLYWHSSRFIMDANYHYTKTRQCEEKGIQLIHIFEDEWINKKEIVKSRLSYILSTSDGILCNARDCTIENIDAKTKNLFLNHFHLMGADSASVKLGAFLGDKLIAVMTFSVGNISKGRSRIDGEWELSRFCCDPLYRCRGIASKLLAHFKRSHVWYKIYSYCDLRWSTGNLYEKLGFELECITSPNYWYVKGCQRYHRYQFRKSMLTSMGHYDKQLSESKIMQLEGYDRIYDCGHLRYSISGD